MCHLFGICVVHGNTQIPADTQIHELFEQH